MNAAGLGGRVDGNRAGVVVWTFLRVARGQRGVGEGGVRLRAPGGLDFAGKFTGLQRIILCRIIACPLVWARFREDGGLDVRALCGQSFAISEQRFTGELLHAGLGIVWIHLLHQCRV